MTLRTEEDILIWRRRLWIALCGGIVLEEALYLSSDRILNEWMHCVVLVSCLFYLLCKSCFGMFGFWPVSCSTLIWEMLICETYNVYVRTYICMYVCKLCIIRGDQKVSVYLTITIHTIEELKTAITEYIRNVDRVILNMVFENTVRPVSECLETGRGHF